MKVTAAGAGPIQDIVLRTATGSDAVTNDPSGQIFAAGKSSSLTGVTTITNPAGIKLFVGPRDDPFFFDLAGFLAGLKFTGVDAFRGTNVTSIILEVPAPLVAAGLGGGKASVWATASTKDVYGNWIQVDRVGRPAFATVFIPSALKDAFNSNTPDRDVAIYSGVLEAALKGLGASDTTTATLKGALLPDVITLDASKAINFLNGRQLPQDVIDQALQAITGNASIGDLIGQNDKAFGNAFPYLATPHLSAPGAPNTGSVEASSGRDLASFSLPAGLVAAGVLLVAAAFVSRKREQQS
jgi:hypothetical protein